MEQNRVWLGERLLEQAVKALKKHEFNAVWFATADQAKAFILESIPLEASVGIGGSITVRQLGLIEVLEERGNRVHQHWGPGKTRQEDLAIRKAQLSSDVFIASSNAVTLEGELVNADGAGNRVGAMVFGPPKVFVVAGVNKLVKDIAEGMRRIKEVAAPMNTHRLSSKTPCAVTGLCNECDAPARHCRVTVIMERKPSLTDLTVVLVNQELGF
ncbi:MAG: lactate utilization protein [Dehalococcoidia bacterium]|nr:lactate utilization protein [Dehalococcoidia bacterium]